MNLEDFDALLALYGASLYECDVADHLMIVHGPTQRVLFVNRKGLRPEHAKRLSEIASSSPACVGDCGRPPWRPVQKATSPAGIAMDTEPLPTRRETR